MAHQRYGVTKDKQVYNSEEDSGVYIIGASEEDWPRKILNRFPPLGEIAHWYPSKNLIWHTSDNEAYYQHNQEDFKHLYEKFGWDDTNIRYSHTKLGNRCPRSELGIDQLKEKGGVMYLGCSYTYGVGVNIEDTWSYKLHQKKFRTRRYINFGIPGYGIQAYYRMLKFYIKKIKPDIIICSRLWNRSRVEAWDPYLKTFHRITTNISNEHMPLIYIPSLHMRKEVNDVFTEPGSFNRMAHFDEEPGVMRGVAYIDAIKQLCYENDVQLYMYPWAAHMECRIPYVPDDVDHGRDLIHPGRKWHEHLVGHYEMLIDDYIDYDLCGTDRQNESIRLRK